MKIYLKHTISLPFIDYDIMQLGGTKHSEEYYYIQYFDFDHKTIRSNTLSLLPYPPQYHNLFTQLRVFMSKKTTLRAQYASLALQMYNRQHSLVFSGLKPNTYYPEELFRSDLTGEEWLQSEQMLTSFGLVITSRHRYHRREYMLPLQQASLHVLVQNDATTLTLEAPKRHQLVEIVNQLGLDHNSCDLSTE